MSLPAPTGSLEQVLSRRIEAVVGVDPELRPATRPQFGHFQSNVALRLAKSEGRPPREVAADIVARLDLGDLCEPPEIAGPGFINLRLTEQTLADAVTGLAADPRLGIPVTERPLRTVIDYSAPNIAKQMHVGHLRTTIIGDCFHRVLTALGHPVIPQNHIGDWGTPMGKTIELIIETGVDPAALTLAEADATYIAAVARFDADPDYAERARHRVVALQSGDPQTRAVWADLMKISSAAFNQTYRRLGVLLTDDDLAGESIYNDALPEVVADLLERGIAVIDNDAVCIFVEGFNAPLIVRKRDGGYNYDTTDMAALRYRVRELHAERLIYVTDARQHDHFEEIFAASRRAGYLPEGVSAEHVGYGMVLDTSGKPLRSRDGSVATLNSLLDAAEAEVAPPIAIAAIKYADLSNGLGKDYVFDLDRMTKTIGDTGPYLQYAHARACGVRRNAEGAAIAIGSKVLEVAAPAEQSLALLLSRFGETVVEVGETLQPHRLCGYLFELAGAYMIFYEQCPVLKSSGTVQESRLALSEATRRVLAQGLDLLGIDAPERM